jgi:hypothetical protein
MRIRIRICFDADPDPGNQNNVDPDQQHWKEHLFCRSFFVNLHKNLPLF